MLFPRRTMLPHTARYPRAAPLRKDKKQMRDYANRERLLSFIAKRKPIRTPDNLRRSRIGYRKSAQPCGIELPAGWPAYGAAARALRAVVATAMQPKQARGPQPQGYRASGFRIRLCSRQRPAPQGVREGAVVAKTPPNSGKRTIIGGRKAQIGPFSGMRGATRKTLR